MSAIALHPRSVSERHSGAPDYALAARLVEELDAPLILTGGLRDAPHTREVFEQTGAAAVMLARGSLGNPWLFRELVEGSPAEPSAEEVVEELEWVMDRAGEHLGAPRAARYLRKFYPWYLVRLRLCGHAASALKAGLQESADLARAREMLRSSIVSEALAA